MTRWQGGDKSALDEMLPEVYDELRRLARIYLSRERTDHTLQPTELVHEAYVRLVNQREVNWNNRAHFLGVAAQVIRRVLLHHAETRNAQKREGYSANRVALDNALECLERDTTVDILTLNSAMERLAEFDQRQSRIVELRVFGRTHHRRSGRCDGVVSGDCETRLERGPPLAAARTFRLNLMTPQRWARIKEVVADALDVQREARPAFLAQACGDDVDLRANVETLLRGDEPGASFLNLDREPERLGAWRVVREIGRGGMGTVYLAERDDGQFEQRAAIKVIKRGMDTDAVLRRFYAERQILARLEHPNITRLLDGGTFDHHRCS